MTATLHVVGRARRPLAEFAHLDAVTYVLHVSQDELSVPPHWVFERAAFVDSMGNEWPFAPDATLKVVWYVNVLQDTRKDAITLKLVCKNRWRVLLTEAQREELHQNADRLTAPDYENAVCAALAAGKQSHLFGRLFMELPPEETIQPTKVADLYWVAKLDQVYLADALVKRLQRRAQIAAGG